MRSAPLKSSVWLVWIALWLFNLLSADLLHAHDFLEHPENHASCLVCHIGGQPILPGPAATTLASVVLRFAEQRFAAPHNAALQPPARLRPLAPRAPPASPSFRLL